MKEMNTAPAQNHTILISVIALLVLGGGYYAYSAGMLGGTIKKSDTMMEAPMQNKMMDDKKMDTMMPSEAMTGEWTKEEMEAMSGDHMMDDKMMMSGSDMMKDDMMKKESAMMQPTGYIDYDEAKVSDALASGQKVALFFHASWCPSCRALDKAITADISSIPTDALIVKVDYDTSTEMKKKYGVTSQHTTVMIDKDMNLISKKLGAKTVTDILN